MRRRQREADWQALRPAPRAADDADPTTDFGPLSPALAAVARLAMSGHSRQEIAYLLHLSDTALRQRISALKRHFTASAVPTPSDFAGLKFDLPYGRIRDALVRHLLRQQGSFASHDPDGHLFVIRGSQTR